jgi:Pyruvate/2-oxoacid:ferredoxin oxidoreductase delta subunit
VNDDRPVVYTEKMQLSHYEKAERQVPGHVEDDKRMDLEVEVNLGYTSEQLEKEVDRCMSCGYCMDCEKCWLYCQDQAIDKPIDGSFPYGWKLENCTGCSKCAEICPCNFIEMV